MNLEMKSVADLSMRRWDFPGRRERIPPKAMERGVGLSFAVSPSTGKCPGISQFLHVPDRRRLPKKPFGVSTARERGRWFLCLNGEVFAGSWFVPLPAKSIGSWELAWRR